MRKVDGKMPAIRFEGSIVKYPYEVVIKVVLESRKPDASIAQICIENGITPRILRFWQQMYANCTTEHLAELVGLMKPREVVIMA